VSIAKCSVDHVSAPKDFTELYEKYYDYVCFLVRKMGINEDEKEDVANSILLRFFERDFLHKFDPSMSFPYKGQMRPARFKSFLSKFVMTYVRSHLEKQRHRAQREVLLCDAPVGDTGDGTWIDLYGATVAGHEDEVIEALLATQKIEFWRRHLATVPARSRNDVCKLVPLLNEVVRHLQTYRFIDKVELREHFGLGATAIHSWLWWLRENLAAAEDRPVPARRARVVRR